MSNPYPPYPPPPPPRRLERSKQNRILGGVCGGVANYLNMDPTLVRVLTVLVALFTGVPIILYLVALFVIPEEGSTPPPPYPPAYPPVTPGQSADPVWGAGGAPWEQPQPAPYAGTPPPAGATPPNPPLQPPSDHSPGDSTEPGDTREPR